MNKWGYRYINLFSNVAVSFYCTEYTAMSLFKFYTRLQLLLEFIKGTEYLTGVTALVT